MGAKEFDDYYDSLFPVRWFTDAGLKQALLRDATAYYFDENLKCPYKMDYASVLAAKSLRLPPEGTILDACAAPGGKTLVLAAALTGGAVLLSNELSGDRRRRLCGVLDTHLPPALRQKVTISGFDAAALAARPGERGRFSAILLDAPCSSERHVLKSETHLAKWTPARVKQLAARQWALLSSAFLLLKSGGSLVYSTCALSMEENDSVAERLIKKYGDSARLDRPDFSEGEPTQYGRLILPDTSGGAGPMYVARFMKCL